jgi:NAD(P)-dependent dehydrogenase (short-subunit alcohol dehydrogenase family)
VEKLTRKVQGAMSGRLDGKVAVVTGGAGSGIGHGISLEMAREGAAVAILEIDLVAAEVVRKQIEKAGGEAIVRKADISLASDIQAAIEDVVKTLGRLDVLVNNAGVGLVRPPAEVSEEEFDRLAGIDLRGMWLCCKFAIPHMQRQKGGAIVNIASIHSRATMPLYALYAAMKSGVVGLTRGIAVHYGSEGIRCNAVCPGLVDGLQTRQVVSKFARDVDVYLQNFVHRRQALPVLIQPRDIGKMVAFLASDDAQAVTGAEIPVDAGTWAMLTDRD